MSNQQQQQPLKAPARGPSLNLANIQGDLVIGLQKRAQAFLFFSIRDLKSFKTALKQLVPDITTTQDVQDADKKIAQAREDAKGGRVWLKINGLNIAFTAAGLTKLGITDDKQPSRGVFFTGAEADAISLGDPVNDNGKLSTWKDEYLTPHIDGVLLVTAPGTQSLFDAVAQLEQRLGKSVHVEFEVEGQARPGANEGREHFGFKDGISVPGVRGINDKTVKPGNDILEPGLILTGYPESAKNKAKAEPAPAWAKDGSFLVFRELEQRVPEFHARSAKLAKSLQSKVPGVTAEFLEARMVGRWPSGAPLILSPLKEDEILGADAFKNNVFDYSKDIPASRCPASAHVRRDNPRAGIKEIPRQGGITDRLMVRQGIPYGPEVSLREQRDGKTQQERGLLFVSYQANIEDQFRFTQVAWSNNPDFPIGTKVPSGLDPIIGQAGGEPVTTQNIADLEGGDESADNEHTLHPQVIPRGGVYAFSPSIAALRDVLSV